MSEISKIDQNLIIKKIDNETVNVVITDNETYEHCGQLTKI